MGYVSILRAGLGKDEEEASCVVLKSVTKADAPKAKLGDFS